MSTRHKGKIIEWQDERGFGFAENNKGSKVFVHIKQFSSKRRRPRIGDTISFEQVPDQRGKPSAIRINLHGGWISFSVLFAITFLTTLAGATVLRYLPDWVVGLYLLMSLFTFISYARDKSAAKLGHWRLSEMSLQLQALIGGWPGALIARHWLRHKSSKTSFSVVLYLMALINVCGLVGLVYWQSIHSSWN
ncbi:DUF1294 domain-containing protein [Shewanella submarina]|uniref:DUF1294 domain-containing protein n=1 Tax=Shewanella submarina TaxID=2016376 RepID=A0ABV7G6A8_9GAMM|nr:DUF1294 domain-containing protein [Shewanella submarina]MCL1039368.1 DUF1294 domain-containing protein [Shewanella submarina]